ncbi:hypothetical protein GOARA_028_00200 [Gordonia araii NBRC 100433]|uniref:Uncharacterized protein n=1 Tax=Gordonia araii NBRC 100433 TaxID=1073574 RepID=G7GZT4_9ACTN|nr:hypothetical protein GOARA_028_00200 [Gordonia araii NBRC 100433]
MAVDPKEYATALGVYFVTPSRNTYCGLSRLISGCQSKRAPVPKGANCVNPTFPVSQLAKGFYIEEDGPIVPSCFNQGVFVASDEQKVLPYGSKITAAGFTCTSSRERVSCTRNSDGHGFDLSTERASQW